MSKEIINKVANSKLITINLEDFYPEGKRVLFDIKEWLFKGLILREKEFREHIKIHNWVQYQNNYVALICSTDAIVPSWAYLLVTTRLTPFAKKVVIGSVELLNTILYQNIINQLTISEYKDKPIIIKGCANKLIPPSAYSLLIEKLQPVAKTIMYGEACSTVPLYKAKKQF